MFNDSFSYLVLWNWWSRGIVFLCNFITIILSLYIAQKLIEFINPSIKQVILQKYRLIFGVISIALSWILILSIPITNYIVIHTSTQWYSVTTSTSYGIIRFLIYLIILGIIMKWLLSRNYHETNNELTWKFIIIYLSIVTLLNIIWLKIIDLYYGNL